VVIILLLCARNNHNQSARNNHNQSARNNHNQSARNNHNQIKKLIIRIINGLKKYYNKNYLIFIIISNDNFSC
jgi:hypothetical protein